MNRNLLTIFGCSTSLAASLALGSPIKAEPSPLRELVFQRGDIETPATAAVMSRSQPRATQLSTATPRNALIQDPLLRPESDTVGDLAVEKFKCDCPPCRMAVVQGIKRNQPNL